MAQKLFSAFGDSCNFSSEGADGRLGPSLFDPFCLDLLKMIEKKLGLSNPVLRGSALYLPAIRALRWEASGEGPNDYDVLANFGAFEEFRRSQAAWNKRSPAAPQNLLDYLNCRPVLKDVDYKLARAPDMSGNFFIEVTGVYKGRKVDLIVQNMHLDPSTVARSTDAPITGIAMDSSGKVYEHPDFRAHAEGLFYCPSMLTDPEQGIQIFNKIKQRFPSLRRGERSSPDAVRAPDLALLPA